MSYNFAKKALGFLIKTTKIPLLFLLTAYGIYFGSVFLMEKYHLTFPYHYHIAHHLMNGAIFITIYFVLHNSLKYGSNLIIAWANNRNYTLLSIIYPPIKSTLEGVLFIVMLNMLLLTLNISGGLGYFLSKAAEVALIVVVAIVFYKIISSLEKFIINKYIDHSSDISFSRKINTQLTILKRIIVGVLILLTFIAITMLFDNIKSLGTGLLTTAGIISAVGAFASQQSLGRIFAGLQLAFTQPMRIGDTVVIDNEFGQVEEISLSFITIKLWDLRRLILPTDYFTNKGLLNLTRESSELLGTIFFHVDYTLPVEKVRATFLKILDQSPLWNKQVAALDVTDVNDKAMEFRCLVSADDASKLWKLRCSVREQLINYIVSQHSECLAVSRNFNFSPIEEKVQNLEPA